MKYMIQSIGLATAFFLSASNIRGEDLKKPEVQPEHKAVRIVALGDSITKGVRPGVQPNDTFCARVERALNSEGIEAEIVNLGAGGERTDQVLKRLDTVYKFRPQFATVMYGTNDSYIDKGETASRISIEDYRSNLKAVVAALHLHGIEPILMTEPRWADNAPVNGLRENPNVRLAPYMEACRAVSKEYHLSLVDHFANWTEAQIRGQALGDWTTDGCHPNAKGHEKLAETLLRTLRKALRPDSHSTYSRQGSSVITPEVNPTQPKELDATDFYSRPSVSSDARRRGAKGAVFVSRLSSERSHADDVLSKTKKALESEEPVRIVCFGDSVTGVYYHSGSRRAYTDMLGIALRRIYPGAKITMINAGISGNTTRDALARIDRDVLEKRPTLVTVMFGLNDMSRVPLQEYSKNIGQIAAKCQAIGAEVIFCTPNEVITGSNRRNERLEEFCNVVRAEGKRLGIPVSDVHEDLQLLKDRDPGSWRLLMSDEVHPNMDGHKRIAESLTRGITGRSTDLSAVPAPSPALPRTGQRIARGELIRVLAMPPIDGWIGHAIMSEVPGARVEVTRWSTEGKNLSELEKDARVRVRPMAPDLVFLSVPREAKAETREAYIHGQAWIMNSSLNFSTGGWDCVVVHPSVVAPDPNPDDGRDALARILVKAQDLTLIDRPLGDKRPAKELLREWIHTHPWKD